MIEFKNVLEDLRTGVEEKFDHRSILAIVVLEFYQAIKESEHELV